MGKFDTYCKLNAQLFSLLNLYIYILFFAYTVRITHLVLRYRIFAMIPFNKNRQLSMKIISIKAPRVEIWHFKRNLFELSSLIGMIPHNTVNNFLISTSYSVLTRIAPSL